MLIVVGGKGGVGKTTLTAAMVRYLQGRGRNDFAVVDADPVGGLATLLGINGNVPTVAATVEEVEEIGQGGLDELLGRLVAAIPGGGVIMRMGHHYHDGCFCRINATTKALIGLLTTRYPLVLMDNEAGLEHVTRGTGSNAGRLILVADESRAAMQVAADIVATLKALKKKGQERLRGSVHLVVRSRGDGETQAAMERMAREMDLPRPVFLPFDADVAKAQIDGTPFPDAGAFVDAVSDWIEQHRIVDTGRGKV